MLSSDELTIQVGQCQLCVDRLDIADGIDSAFHMRDIGIDEAADNVQDRIDLADMGEELVAEPFAGRGAADDAGDIDDPHGRGDNFLRRLIFIDLRQPLIGHGYDADVGLNRWQTDNSPPTHRRQR